MSIDHVATEALGSNLAGGSLGRRQAAASSLFWILRLTGALEFFGHGMVGVATNPAWLPYFAVVGISATSAYRLMPLIGVLDLAVGLACLLAPRPGVLIYATIWGLWTAVLRPLAGQGGWLFLEEVRNGLLPASLLLLAGVEMNLPGLLWQRLATKLDPARAKQVAWLLRLAIASLLVGHGGMSALTGQVAWPTYLAVLGVSPATTQSLGLASLIGWFEIVLGGAVLLRPAPGLLLFVFAWKLVSEALRPLAGEAIGQFVERAASYGAPIALIVLTRWSDRRDLSETAQLSLGAGTVQAPKSSRA